MRTDDLAKRAGKRSQHIIYKTISKSALSLYILGFFLYKGGRGRGPGGRGSALGGPAPRQGRERAREFSRMRAAQSRVSSPGAWRGGRRLRAPGASYRASMSLRVWEGGRSRISADRGVVLRGDTGRPPSVEMSGGGALSAAVGGVLLSSPFWWPAVGLMRG